MVIWVIFSLMTVAVIIAILWPLSRPETALQQADDADIAFYKEQTSEIDRDLARGLLSPEEAEAAKAEAGRRLLRSARSDTGIVYAEYDSKPSLNRRRTASVLALAVVPVLGLGLYWVHGVPDYAVRFDEARIELQKRQGEQSEDSKIAAAVEEMEQHLKANPADGRGWELIAPVYLRIGRADNSVAAYEKTIELLGESSQRLTGYGRALFYAANGVVYDKAREVFEKAAAMDPKADVARFYLGYAAEMNGDPVKAKEYYNAALAITPDWPVVRERLAQLDKPQQDDDQHVSPEAINAMIDSMAARLDQDGGKPEEWVQLVRSYMVTGQKDKAIEAAAKARKALAANRGGLDAFENAVRPLKLDNGGEK